MKTGIDVSNHNGAIAWEDMEYKVDFAIVRGGYSCTKDERADYNLSRCNQVGIPVGVYWFSYATTVEAAKREAEACLRVIKPYRLDLPVAFDYEYDSVDYAKKRGVTVTADLMCDMANAFLAVIKEAGYTPMLYTNIDFLNRGFSRIAGKYKLWLAEWSERMTMPSRDCDFWQYTDRMKIDGFSGVFDGNRMLVESESKLIPEYTLTDDLERRFLSRVCREYFDVAEQILKGQWGNGETRKQKLREAGYDYQTAQAMVNVLLDSHESDFTNI